jgi:hypothetical protein
MFPFFSKINSFVFKPVKAQAKAPSKAPAAESGQEISTDVLPGVTFGDGRFDSLSSIILFAINTVFIIGLALSLIFVIIGGIKYITSQGDEGKAGEARTTITNAVIGAVVIIGFRVILGLVLSVLGWNEVKIPGVTLGE